MRKTFVVLAALSMACGAMASMTYDNQAAFLGAIESGYYLEDFGTPATSYIAPAVFTDGTYAWSAAAGDDLYIWGSDYAGGTPCVGSMGTNGAGYEITFTFSGAPVTAFGGNLYLTDQYFDPVAGEVTIALNDGTSVTLDSPYATSFTGFTSDVPITSVTMTPDPSSTINLYGTVDSIIVGTAIPEPASLVLLGLGVLAMLRRR